MTQAVLITVIICATVAFLGLCGIGLIAYIIKKGGIKSAERDKEEEEN